MLLTPAELLVSLRAAGDPLHLAAADALALSLAQVARLHARVELLEGVARLNGETIRSMQRAAAEPATNAIRSLHAERNRNPTLT